MLSSVLNSERAVQVNIEVMHAFVRLRYMLVSREDLRDRLDQLEQKHMRNLGLYLMHCAN
jgi:hypothetical protein